jgi:hypothetical protein
MTIDELQNKPPILEGLADWIMSCAARSMMQGYDKQKLTQWACEVRAIQEAITQVGEEE